jgi:hypothetical protein
MAGKFYKYLPDYNGTKLLKICRQFYSIQLTDSDAQAASFMQKKSNEKMTYVLL